MILSDRDIKKYIEQGRIKINPAPNFEEQLGPCSLDLHLGDVFKIFKHSEFPYIDLKTKTPIDQIMQEIKIEDGKPLILQPRDFILAVTKEEISLPADIMVRLDGRSSLGRLGVVVHSTAARFDPGWQGRGVMEIGNLGIMAVALYPGMRICALTFETLSSPCEKSYLEKKGQKYGRQTTPNGSKINQEFNNR